MNIEQIENYDIDISANINIFLPIISQMWLSNTCDLRNM